MKRSIIFLILLVSVCYNSWAGIDFDGTDDYVDSNYLASYSSTNSFTYCAWAILDGVAAPYAEDWIIGAIDDSGVAIIQYGFDTSCGSGLKPRVYIRDDTNTLDNVCSTGTAVTVGVLFSLCLVYDDPNADVILYQDGVNIASDTAFSATGAKTFTTNGGAELGVGARNDRTVEVYNSQFDGKIYEVAMWRSALTPTQILQYHNMKMSTAPCSINNSTLEKYLPMNNGEAGTSADGDSVINMCGSDSDSAVGNDGANNTGLSWTSSPLNLPVGIIQ